MGFFRLLNLKTGSSGVLADDSVHSYRRDAERGEEYGYLFLTAQPYLHGQGVYFRPVTRPGEALPVTPIDLLSEAYPQASLECHFWKSKYLAVHGEIEAPTATDVWDAMDQNRPSNRSEEEFARYLPPFRNQIPILRDRLDPVIRLFHHVLSHDCQADLVRATRQLEVESSAYLQLPALLRVIEVSEADVMFRRRFEGVGRVLARLAREADRRRDLLQARNV